MTHIIAPESVRLVVDGGRVVIPGEDVQKATTSSRAGQKMDTGELVINNDDPYPYTVAGEIRIGDRISFDRTVTTEGTLGFGTGGFGEGPMGDYASVGLYLVQGWDCIEHGPGHHELVLQVGDFVYSILDNRTVFLSRTARPISGSPDAILNTALRENAPEIDRSMLPTITEPIDYFVNGKTLRDVVDELAQYIAYHEEPVVHFSAGDTLHVEPLGDLSPITDEPMGPSFSQWTVAGDDQNLVNSIRITGALDTSNIDDEQTQTGGTVTVSKNNRVWTRLSTRKSEITRLALYTKGVEHAEAPPRVRLQVSNDAGDAPIAPTDEDSDIVTSSSSRGTLTPGGWTIINLPEHTIPERNPWLIVDTGATAGYPIGTDGSGTPAYQAYFPKRLAAEVPAPNSIAATTRVEEHIRNESIITLAGLRSRANAFLERHATVPTVIGPLEAVTEEAHALQVGDVVTFDRPELRAVGDFLATKRETTYEGNRLRVDIEFEGLAAYA